MNAYIVSERQLRGLIHTSTIDLAIKDLFFNMVKKQEITLTQYFYDVLSSCMLNYVDVNDESLSKEESYRIHHSFAPILDRLKYHKPHIQSVDPIDVIYDTGCMDLYGKFNSNLYDDLFDMLESMAGETAITLMEDMCDLICFVVATLEGYYVNFSDNQTVTRMTVASSGTHLYIYAI